MNSFYELAKYGRYFAGLLIYFPMVGKTNCRVSSPTTLRAELWRKETKPQIHQSERHATGWTPCVLRWASRPRLCAGTATASRA